MPRSAGVSDRFALVPPRLSFLPISERSGPTSLPAPLTMWQLAQVPVVAKRFLPLSVLPCCLTRSLIGGRGLSFLPVGRGNSLHALLLNFLPHGLVQRQPGGSFAVRRQFLGPRQPDQVPGSVA